MADPTTPGSTKPFHIENAYLDNDKKSQEAARTVTFTKADKELAKDQSYSDAQARQRAIDELMIVDSDSVDFDYNPATFQATYKRFADHIREGRAVTDSASEDYIARGRVELKDAEAAAQAFKVDFTLLTTEMTKVYHEFERNGIDGEALDPILKGIFLGAAGLGVSIAGQVVTDLPLKTYALYKESFRKWYIQNEAWKAIKKDPSMLACLKEGGADIPTSKFHGMGMPNLMSKGTTKAMLVLSGFLAGIVGLFEAYDRYFLNSDDGVGAASQESLQADPDKGVSVEDLEGLAEVELEQRSLDEVSTDVGIALGSREHQDLVMTILIDRNTSVEKIQHEILSGEIKNAKRTYDTYVDFVNAQCSAYNSVNSFTAGSPGYIDPEQFTEKKMGGLIDKILSQTGFGRWVDRNEQLAMLAFVAIPLMVGGTLGSSEFVMDFTTSVLEGVGLSVQDAQFKQQVETDIESLKLEITGPYLECVDEKETARDLEKVAKEAEIREKYKKPAVALVPVAAPGGEEEESAVDPSATPAPAGGAPSIIIAPNAAPGAQSALSSAATYVSETWAGLKPIPMDALFLQSAANSAGGNVSGQGGVSTKASPRVMYADAEPLPGWVRKPGGGAEYNPEKAAEIKAAKSKPGAPVEAPITPRGLAKAGAGMAATTLVVAGLEMYADEKLDELGVPEKNQDALFDTTNTGLLGYAIYANPVTVGGVPWAYLGGDLAQTETRSLVEEYVPEPYQDTVTQATGVVGGGTGFVTGMGITYTIGAAAGGTTLLEISVLGGPVTILAGAIGYALYQDYKQYRYLKETREHFLTQAPEAERDLFIDLSATLELGLEGELTHEKLQKIRDVISKEPYQSFLNTEGKYGSYGQYFIDAYLDPFIGDYTAVPHVPAPLLLPVLLASDVGSPSSEPKRDYTVDLGLIRDEILHPYADKYNAEIYRYTDPLTGLPSMIPPTPKKSDTRSVGAGSPGPMELPARKNNPYTTNSAEPRLLYDTTKEGEVLYAELAKQYPFEQGDLLLKISDTCKKLHADGKYTVAAEILNHWLQDAQKIVSQSQTSYSAAFKEATTFTNPFTGSTFEGFSPTGVIDDEESRDLTMNHFLPLEDQIARYAHGDIADLNEVLTKLNELKAKMADTLGWDLWKDLL